MRKCWVIILVCGLLLTGCGEKETTTSTEPAPAVQPTVVEQVKKTTEDVAKQATEVVETGTQLVKDTAADAKLAVKEVVAAATKDVTAVTEVAKQKTAKIINSSKQKVVEVKEQLQQEGTQLLNGLEKSPATSETPDNLLPSVTALAGSVTAPGKVATKVQASETLVIENKNGNVTLFHAEHGKLYGCASCHGDAVPGPFELGKDTAHAMCKGCHKEQGGPTKCTECHKK